MLHGWEQLNRVENLLLEILRDASCQLPDTFEDEFSNFELLGVRSGSIAGERFNNLKQKIKKCPGAKVRMGPRATWKTLPEHRHPTSCGKQS